MHARRKRGAVPVTHLRAGRRVLRTVAAWVDSKRQTSSAISMPLSLASIASINSLYILK